MTKNMEPVQVAGSALSHSCHVCAFFHSKEEEYRVPMPFSKDGFEKGDGAFHVIDAKRRPAPLRRPEQEGIDVATAGKLTRLAANMEWALEDLPEVDDIVEYEARLNHVLPKYHDPAACTHELSRREASMVIDIKRTHPIVIVGGHLARKSVLRASPGDAEGPQAAEG
jgi:hypothetical protein